MEKTFWIYLLLLGLFGLGKSEIVRAQDVSIKIGVRESLQSEILQENRKLLIHLPDVYQTSGKSYPGHRFSICNHNSTYIKSLKETGLPKHIYDPFFRKIQSL